MPRVYPNRGASARGDCDPAPVGFARHRIARHRIARHRIARHRIARLSPGSARPARLGAGDRSNVTLERGRVAERRVVAALPARM